MNEAEERLARRQAQAAQRESEARFRRMADKIRDGLTIVEHGKVVYINDRACEIFGYPRDELVQLSILELAAPEEKERLGQVVAGIQQMGTAPRELEFWTVAKDGTRRCVQNRYAASREGDRVVGYYVVTTDVTERKLLEQEVEQRRLYLESVLACAPDAIVTLDARHKILEWNPGAARLFGYTQEEAVGRDLDELIAGSDAAMLEQATGFTREVLAGRPIPPTETVRYRKDGGPVDVIVSGSPILIGNELVGVVGIYTDISGRKRARRLLRALNQAALAMREALTPEEIFAAVGEELKKLGFSCMLLPAHASRSGLYGGYVTLEASALEAAEELVGLKPRDLWARIEDLDVYREVVRERMTVFIERGEDVLRQALPGPMQGLAGQLARVLEMPKAVAAPLIVGDEAIGVFSVHADDLTEDDLPAFTAFAHQMAAAWRKAQLFEQAQEELAERVRAEEMLRRRNRELTTLYEVGHDISATLDLPTVLERIATHARDLMGADGSELYLLEPDGQTLRAIVAVGAYERQLKAISLRLGEGLVGHVARSGEAEVVNDVSHDPRNVYVPGVPEEGCALMCAPLVSKGQAMGVMALARLKESVSERGLFDEADLEFLIALARQAAVAIENARLFARAQQHAAELAQALEHQQELDRLKNEFIQNVSHELRAPLAITRGYADLLESGQLGELQPDQQKPVAIVARRVRMLAKLVDDLTASLETERKKLKREWVNLASLVREQLADFQVAAGQAELSLTAQITPDLPPVFGDPMHLRRVLDNLVGNALKFTPAGGHIVVRLLQDDQNLVLEVADSGIGIPADQMGRIFERFYQVDGSVSRRYSGAGLGLALVKEIIEAHGGTVGVQSEVGVGSTFTVTLPVAGE